jgi:hypothetical protein
MRSGCGAPITAMRRTSFGADPATDHAIMPPTSLPTSMASLSPSEVMRAAMSADSVGRS